MPCATASPYETSGKPEVGTATEEQQPAAPAAASQENRKGEWPVFPRKLGGETKEAPPQNRACAPPNTLGEQNPMWFFG